MTEIVKTFSNEMEAKLAQSLLSREGIPATLHRHSRYRAMGGGGYTVQCDMLHLSKALKLLAGDSDGVDMDEYVGPDEGGYRRCPECHSVNLAVRPLSTAAAIMVVFCAGLPLLFLKRDRRCRKCGHTWRG